MSKILYCNSCRTYTLKKACKCGKETASVEPPKFSLRDKYGKYRRLFKKRQIKES